MDVDIDWWPQPKQLAFMRACGMSGPFEEDGPDRPEARIIGYGGAAGGGKTDALLGVGIVAGLIWPGCTVGFFRRTYPELEGPGGAIQRSHELMSGWATWNGNARRWKLPGGSLLQFCHCQNEKDVFDYQSLQFDVLLVDEATHFTRFQVRYLMTRNRATMDGVTPIYAMASNPGNVGHLWFKDEFVDAGPPDRVHEVEVEPGQFETHKFIPAKLSDNQILEQRDPEYRDRLEKQPEETRRGLLYGDWDVFAGQVFAEWRRDLHVIPPCEIPDEWIRWRAVDWGYQAPMCCLWLAAEPDSGRVVVYRELYETGLYDEDQADRIKAMTAEDERIKVTLADPSMWQIKKFLRQTVSTADIYKAHGVPLTPADHDRLLGVRRVHEALKVEQDEDGTETPGLLVFENCRNLIRTLPALPRDETHIEDVDTDAEDHAFDSLRYGLMWRVRGPRREPDKGKDPYARVKRGKETDRRRRAL